MVLALCIAGTPADCARQLRAYEAAGLGTAVPDAYWELVISVTLVWSPARVAL